MTPHDSPYTSLTLRFPGAEGKRQARKEERVAPPGRGRVPPRGSFFKMPFCSSVKQMEV